MTVWELYKDKVLLGTFRACKLDWPWLFCQFEPTPAFEPYRVLFETESALLNRGADPEWEKAYERIAQQCFALVPVDLQRGVQEFLLHIEGDQGWFRVLWDDE
jgi:hypothetical protein